MAADLRRSWKFPRGVKDDDSSSGLPLHVLVTADTQDKADKAKRRNERKKRQLRGVAEVNGSLCDDDDDDEGLNSGLGGRQAWGLVLDSSHDKDANITSEPIYLNMAPGIVTNSTDATPQGRDARITANAEQD